MRSLPSSGKQTLKDIRAKEGGPPGGAPGAARTREMKEKSTIWNPLQWRSRRVQGVLGLVKLLALHVMIWDKGDCSLWVGLAWLASFLIALSKQYFPVRAPTTDSKNGKWYYDGNREKWVFQANKDDDDGEEGAEALKKKGGSLGMLGGAMTTGKGFMDSGERMNDMQDNYNMISNGLEGSSSE